MLERRIACLGLVALLACAGTAKGPASSDGGGSDASNLPDSGVVSSVVLNPTLLRIPHKVGTTACPTPMGTVTITNTRAKDISFTVTSPTAQILATPTTGTVQAGKDGTVTVVFTCSAPQSVDAQLAFGFQESGGAFTDTASVHAVVDVTQ